MTDYNDDHNEEHNDDHKLDPKDQVHKTWSNNADSITGWAEGKSGLEKALQIGIHGVPELHKEEKEYFIGEFRERVMKVLTKKQMLEPQVFEEIRQSLLDPRSVKIIIDGSVPDKHNDKYEKLAASLGKASTTRRDVAFKGNIGLLVVSDHAVDFDDDAITVTSWADKMRSLGIPEKLIAAAGQKVCKSCFNLLSEKAPESIDRYHQLSVMDKVLGMKCPAH